MVSFRRRAASNASYISYRSVDQHNEELDMEDRQPSSERRGQLNALLYRRLKWIGGAFVFLVVVAIFHQQKGAKAVQAYASKHLVS